MLLKNFQKGSAIYFTAIIMTILLTMTLVLGTILIRQIKVIKKMGDSMIAFYAADTGWEVAMYNFPATGTWVGYLDLNRNNRQDPDDAIYEAWRKTEIIGTDCEPEMPINNPLTNYCIISIGEYKNLQRKIFMRH